MKKNAFTFCMGLFFILISSCSTTREIPADNKLKFALQAGSNLGGITENTDMAVVPNLKVPTESMVDAFTGATQLGCNFGIHASKKLKNNQIETGLDYMFNYQTFSYNDEENFYMGTRRLQVSQMMLPFTYNMVLFRHLLPNADLQFKVGALGQFNLVSSSETGTSLPTFSINPWSMGLTIGFSAYPFRFSGGNKLGFYFDGYRGSQIYEDFYNQAAFEMPGSSFMKFGLKYQFK